MPTSPVKALSKRDPFPKNRRRTWLRRRKEEGEGLNTALSWHALDKTDSASPFASLRLCEKELEGIGKSGSAGEKFLPMDDRSGLEMKTLG